jgi:hypothetical protein
VNWITIIPADLNDARVAELIDSLRQEELGTGQGDPLPRFIVSVTEELRAAIAFSGKYQVDSDTTTIPNGLKEIAVLKIVRSMKGRLLQALTDDEKADAKTYEARLVALNEAQWPVATPDHPISPTEVQADSISPRITRRRRHFGHCDQDGI